MVSDDFSFPKITNPLPQLTSLPSLWRVTSLVYPEYGDNEEDVDSQVLGLQRKSFSIACLSEREANKRESDDPEKMDMLWEEFNEELKRVSSSSSRKDARVVSSRGSGTGIFAEPSRESSLELYNGQAQARAHASKMTKTGIGSGMIYHKRQSKSMLTVMKTLKKMFYLRNLVWVKN
ncbi:uncharacterized protein LOC111316369 [Durio zibethinus]|uniref:Uncharacterized protein LOC111316369 n=1 Tax=Durio zibethinus TaxID=66656 RepID=A0A6P6BAF2_DURZI|nr:uncharacterized protein LOC111316369 [Durio zibethinus]